MARALELPGTAVALDRYGRRAGGVLVGGGLVCALAAGVALVSPGEPWTGDLVGALAAVGVLTLAAGAASWALALRMRRVLGSGTWSAHPAVSVRSLRTTEAVVLRSPAGDELWPLEVAAMRQRYEPLRPGPDGVMWWCGDPARGGVLAPPGGEALLWARPVRHRRARRRIVEQAERTGILGRAVLAQPQERPEPDRHVRGPVPAPRVSLVKAPESDVSGAPTYARLAAHAARQAVTQPQTRMQPQPQARTRTRARRPEADVREVAWWRVRSLRRVAGVGRLLGALALCAATLAAVLLRLDGGSLMKLFVLAIVGVAALAVAGYQLVTGGLPAVRSMARAARSPVLVLRRYVLLHDPQNGVPVLVLFPDHGGGHALPEGLLALMPPGTAKDPRRGLPPEPTGTVELRGWRDFSAEGLAVVVARVGEGALWPAELYRPSSGAASAALLARLAPPQEPAQTSTSSLSKPRIT
ncbi:hypothetical protein ACHGLA_01120 [Streptomyces sp. YH02]|uniref:hypothetical protein n=1 Tax=Streptomyces sp. YH02 TaxID=3256999 RepID=UPI0037580F45